MQGIIIIHLPGGVKIFREKHKSSFFFDGSPLYPAFAGVIAPRRVRDFTREEETLADCHPGEGIRTTQIYLDETVVIYYDI